jgi:hypothetical protein
LPTPANEPILSLEAVDQNNRTARHVGLGIAAAFGAALTMLAIAWLVPGIPSRLRVSLVITVWGCVGTVWLAGALWIVGAFGNRIIAATKSRAQFAEFAEWAARTTITNDDGDPVIPLTVEPTRKQKTQGVIGIVGTVLLFGGIPIVLLVRNPLSALKDSPRQIKRRDATTVHRRAFAPTCGDCATISS